jgi:8-hydroxy-5-deazaflavin:NADPH oxidoreductase
MSSTQRFTVGTIGAGSVAQAVAGQAIAAGHQVILSNSRGPETLKDVVERLGAGASAGTVAEAAQADLVLLAVGWDAVPAAVNDINLAGRIVIDATNQWGGPGTEIVDLGDQTGSEHNAALMPGARVVKAFNTLLAGVTAQNPSRTDGRLVVFIAGDDPDAKDTVSDFVDSMGFSPVDLGGAREGRLMQAGGPLGGGLQVVKPSGTPTH